MCRRAYKLRVCGLGVMVQLRLEVPWDRSEQNFPHRTSERGFKSSLEQQLK